MKAKRVLLLVAILVITGCNTIKNVSNSDPYFWDKIDRTICIKNHVVVRRYLEASVGYPKLQEYMISPETSTHSLDETFEDFKKYRRKYTSYGYAPESIPIPRGTELMLKEVYFYNRPPNGGGFIVRALVNDPAVGDQLVDVSRFFDTDYVPIGSSYDTKLKLEHAEYCD